MATEDDKPQTTFATDRENEEREFQTEVSDIPVTKLPLAEMTQVEPLHDAIEGSCELKNGELNTEPDSSNLNKDESGGGTILYSIEATSAHNAEVKDVGKGDHFEDGSTENKFNTTTASLEGDPHETSFARKEAKSSDISSTPEDTKLDPEILHSSVSVTDEIIQKEDSSDLSQSTSTQIACQSDHIEETKGNAQIAEIQPASHVITLNTTNASSGTAGSVNKNYEVKSTDDATDDSNEDVGISSHSEHPNKKDEKKEKENGDSNKEQLSSPLFAESTEETISKSMDSDKVERLEENSGTKNEDNQDTSKLSLDKKEIKDNELDILGTSCDKPESIREVSDVASISKESQPKEREVSDIVLMSEKENQPKEIHEDDPEQMMQQKEEVSSEEHNLTSQGSHELENKSGEDLQVKNIISMCPKKEANNVSDQEIRGNTSENVATDLEEDQSNRRITESAEENSSLQKFQMIAKANKVVDEANNPELLPIKDLSTVTSEEVPEAVITEAAKDVIWEQKEVPITKESEEIKKRNDELADATNLLSQSSEENINNYQAIEEPDDCTDNTNISRMPEEEKRLEEVHVDDKSLAASDIDSQEKPLENNNRSNTGLSSEEVGDVNLGNVLDLALQHQTTESEHANEDSISIGSSNLTENEAAGKESTDKLYRSQDQGVKKIIESGDTHTVKCDAENIKKEDSCKGTAVPKCESSDSVIESNVGSDQTSSAAKVADILEVIPSVMLPKGEDHETWNILQNKKAGSTNTNEDIVNDTSDASFATTFNEAFFQKEENEAPESDFRDSPFKDITEEHNGIEASEAQGKEHIAEVDDPAIVKCEKRMELPIEKKTEEEKSLNADDTSKDDEQLDISWSLGIGTQPNKDDQQEEATELFKRPDEVAQSKIGNKHRSIEDSSCCSPREEINQKSDQEDDLKLEVDPGVKADGTFVATNNTSSSTKFEEPEITDATESFKKEMATEEKVVEGPSQVSAEDETAKYTAEKGTEKRNVNDTTTYDEFKQEADPEAKGDETTNNASQSTKTEEPETIYSTQSFQKQISDEGQVVEGPHQTAEEISNDQPPEENKERNLIDTKKKAKLKPEPHTGLSADEISETTKDASNSTKFEEAEAIEATQSFNNHLLRNDKVGEGSWQIADQLENYIPAEEGKEESNVKDKTAADEFKPEIHTGEKFEETEAVEATQKLNTPVPSGGQVVEVPFQPSNAEDVVNYSTAEEGKEERNAIDTTEDDLKPVVDPEVKFEGTKIFDATQIFRKQSPTEDKGVEGPSQISTAEEIVNYCPTEEAKDKRNVKDTEIPEELNPELAPAIKPDEISETINNASFQEPEPNDASQSVNKQIPSEEKVVEQPDQVLTVEEIVKYHFAEEGEEKNVKDITTADELQPKVDPGERAGEISDTTHFAIQSAKFEDPKTVDATQSFNKQTTREDKVVEGPPQVSIADEAANYGPVEEEREQGNIEDATLSYELNPDVDRGEKVNKVSESTKNASESTKFKEPHCIDVSENFKKDIPSEDKVVEEHPQVSTDEEIVNHSPAREGKADSNVKEITTRNELKLEVDPKVQVCETSETTKTASETAKLEVPEIIEATHGITTHMPGEDKVAEGTPEVSIAENDGNSRLAEGRKEDRKVNNATGDELPTRTKLEETNEIDVTQSFEKEIPQKANVVEEPCQVSAAEEPVNDNSTEGEERNVIDAAIQDELKPGVAPGTKLDEISENMKNASESTKFHEPEPIAATQCVNKQIKSEDKVVEGSHHVLTADEIVNYYVEGEGEVKNVKDTIPLEEYQELNSKTESGLMTDEISETHYASESTKFKEPEADDATTSFQEEKPNEGKIVEGHPKVSTAEEIVNYCPAQESKDERNVKDTAILEALNPKLVPAIEAHEISETINNASVSTKFQEPEPNDASQSVNKQIPSEDKVVEQPDQVSTVEEIVKYHFAEEENVKDITTADELQPKVDPGERAGEISDTTHFAIQSAKFEDPKTVDATQSFNKQTTREDKVVEGPPQASTADEAVNYGPVKEEREQGNIEDTTLSYELNPDVDREEKVNKVFESTDNASESTKFEEPHHIDVSENLKKDIPSEDRVVEGHPQVSTEEENNVKETTNRDELKPEVDPKVEVEVPEIVEATHGITTHMPGEDKVAERTPEVSNVEDVGNYRPAEGIEDRKFNDATGHELPTRTKLEETNGTGVTQSFEKETPQKGNVVEEPCQASAAEEPLNDNSTEGEESNVIDAAIQDELKPEVAPGIKLDEISENKNASESTKFHEPEPNAATQSVNKQIKSEDKVVEGSHHVLTADEIVNYYVEGKGEVKNVKDTIPLEEYQELNSKTEAGLMTDEISETHYASESTKFKEPEADDATTSFQEEKPNEGKIVEGHPKVSTAKEIVNYCSAEEAKDERNVKDTAILEELNPELVPAIKPHEISETINNASFQEPEPNDGSQSVTKQIPSEDKVVEQPDQVSTAEEIVKYHFAEGEEKNVKDITIADELQPKVDPGERAGEISDTTHFAIQSVKFEDPKTVDATQSFNKQTIREDKVVEGPSQVSTADEVVNYGPVEEESEQGNIEDATPSYELNPDVDRGEKVNKVSESTDNASESTKFEEPHHIDVSENLKKDIPSKDKVVVGHPQVLTEEEIVNYSPAKEGKAESNVKETTTKDELKPEVDPKVELEVPEIVEATHGITTHIPSEDKVAEGTPEVSIAEDVGNYRDAEGIKEDRKANNATGDELPTRTKLEETNGTGVTQSFEKEIPQKGNVVEEPCQASAAEEPVNDNSTEGEERNVIDAAIQDELKPEVALGIKLDEISENMKNASESTKVKETHTQVKAHKNSHQFKEPEAVDATTSFQEEKPKEGKIVEGHPKVSTAEEIANYSPAEEEKDERSLKDTNTIISDELNHEVDPGEISPTMDNANQITKLEGPEVTDVTTSSNKDMQSEDMAVEGPSQVSTPEGIVSHIPEEEEEEGKAERNVKETSTRDELKMEADPKIEEDEISETKNSSAETTEFELPENIEATTEVNIQMPSEDKIAEGSMHVSIAEHAGSCSLEEERKDKNVSAATGYELPTRIKLEGSYMTDATRSFEKEIPKQPVLVSAAEELLNDSPAEEGKEERNMTDAASQDELQPEVAPGIKLDEISMTMKNFQEPEPIDATQRVKEQITSEEKVVEGPYHVSAEEEVVSYHLPDEGEEKNVKDTITMDELKLKAQSGVRTDEISETHYASESTKFKEAKTVDATSSFQKQMPKEDNVVKGPPIVSTAEQIVNCSPAEEEKEERNAKDTTMSDDLKPEVDPGAKHNELSETIDNASESTKTKEPERIEVTQTFNHEVPMEHKVLEGPPHVSTAEEIVNYCCAEEAKTERNVNETAAKEPNTEVNPKVEVDEVSKTTKRASEITKFEVPGKIEATEGINIQMPSEEKVIEEPLKVPIAEDVGNHRQNEERKEDLNVQNTTADKLPTEIKLEETGEADVICFKKQIARKDQVVEGPCQVSTAEELVNFIPLEEEKEESSVMDAPIQDEVKPEVAPEIKPDEILKTLKNASESTEIQEPEMIDATQSSNKQMTYEDRDIEGPHQVSTAEGIDHYSLAQGENVNDTRMLDELKPEENPEARADYLSETTYYASRSTKFEEPDTLDANQNFNKQMPSGDEVVEGPPQVSTAEEMVDYNPAEERKEEPNIKDTTTSSDLKPEVDPELKPNNISNIINNTSQNTKLEDDEIMHVNQNCNKQMPSEDKVAEEPPQVAAAEEIQNYIPAEEGKEESSVKDTSAKDDLKTEVYPSVKFEEPKTIDATQSSKKKILSEDNVVGGSFKVSTAKEITHYSIEYEEEETNVKDTTTADESKMEENTRGKFDETETTDATQSFEKQMPSDVEGYHQGSTAVEIVNYSPAEEEKEERNVKVATTKLELQEQAAKLPSRNTETEVTTSDEKVEIHEVGFPKYDEGVKGCHDRQNIYRNDLEVTARESSEKLGEYSVSEAETLKPVDEKIDDYPESKDVAKDDTDALESHKDDGQTQYSPSKSLYEITNDPGGLNLEKEEGSVDKAVILLHSATSGDEESNKLDKKEQYLLITEKESRKDDSSTAQGSRFKDEEKEEKVEEQGNHSTRTSVLDGDEILSKKIENEDKIFHNQNQNSDLPIIGQESAREIQVEIKKLHPGKDSIVVASEVGGESGGERKTSDQCEGTLSSIKSDLIPEVKVRDRPTEEILAKAEYREDKDQVDTSIKEIAKKDELADLTQATNNSKDIDMPCKSSVAMSDLEIMANGDPETGSESKILSENKEIAQVQEGPIGETLQPETEELKPGDASQSVAEAVREEYGEKEQLNDDCNKQTENFGSATVEEKSPSELEQSSQETPQEKEDGEAQDQQNNINDSRVEIARNEGPLDASSQMDTNLPLDMQKLEVAPCCEFYKQVEEADPNNSSVDTKDLPEVQQKAIAESFCAGGENQEPVKCSEDKETEEAIGKSILEEKSTTSLTELLEVPRNEISQDSGDFNSESKHTIQREEMKDGKTRTCEPEEQNTDEDKDEEGEGNKQQRAESGYDRPVAVEASRDINVKASPKKSHNILFSVGSKVKHSISKVKKVITGKSSHPKPSSPK